MDEHAYGKLLVSTSEGRWYWDEVFMDVSWVPKGCRKSTIILYLSLHGNSRGGALCEIVKYLTNLCGAEVRRGSH